MASSTAALPPLLTCPAALLTAIFEHLEVPDLVRLLVLTTKHPAIFWTAAVYRFLVGFIPARLWFDVKGTGSSYKRMSSYYRDFAEEGERQLAALLAKAGVAGAKWVWEDVGRGSNTERPLVLAPASVLLADKTRADYMACLKAFSCTSCCASAGCGRALCARCAGECEEKGCPFALCPDCDSPFSRTACDVPFGSPTNPGFIKSACDFCPATARCCPAHTGIASFHSLDRNCEMCPRVSESVCPDCAYRICEEESTERLVTCMELDCLQKYCKVHADELGWRCAVRGCRGLLPLREADSPYWWESRYR